MVDRLSRLNPTNHLPTHPLTHTHTPRHTHTHAHTPAHMADAVAAADGDNVAKHRLQQPTSSVSLGGA